MKKILMFLIVGLVLGSLGADARVQDASKTFGESANNNFWSIYEQRHYDCFSLECTIYPRVCNDKNQQRTMNMSVFADIEPKTILQWQNTSTGTKIKTGENCALVNGSNVCSPIYSDYREFRYGPVVSVLLDGAVQGKKFKKVSSSEILFEAFECTDFKVTLKNTFGGNTKFDVWFLDSILNSTSYRGDFSVDLNRTQSNVTITSRMISLGTFFNITEAWDSGKRTSVWINKTNLTTTPVTKEQHITGSKLILNITEGAAGGMTTTSDVIAWTSNKSRLPNLRTNKIKLMIRGVKLDVFKGGDGGPGACIRLIDDINYSVRRNSSWVTTIPAVVDAQGGIAGGTLDGINSHCYNAGILNSNITIYTNVTIFTYPGLSYYNVTVNGWSNPRSVTTTGKLSNTGGRYLQFIAHALDSAGADIERGTLTVDNITYWNYNASHVPFYHARSNVMSFSTNVTRFTPVYKFNNDTNKFKLQINVSCNGGTTWTSHIGVGQEVACIKKGRTLLYDVRAINRTATLSSDFSITDFNMTFEQRCRYPFTEDWNISNGQNESCIRKTIDMNTSSWINGSLHINSSTIVMKKQRTRNISVVSRANLTILNTTINATNARHTIRQYSSVSRVRVNGSKLMKVDFAGPVLLKKFNMVTFTTTKSNRVPSSNISFTKNITNSTIVASRVNTTNIKNCVILDSTFRATQGCLNAFIDPSFIENSTITGSNIRNSTINHSTVTFTHTLKANITDSNINSSKINSSVLTNVNVSFSKIINSTLSNMNLPRGTNISNNQPMSRFIVSYPMSIMYVTGVPGELLTVQVKNRTGQVTFTKITDTTGNVTVNVTYSASSNISTINLPEKTPTPGFTSYTFSFRKQNIARATVTVSSSSGTGGGATTQTPATTTVPVTSITTFEQLIAYSPQVLATLTSTEITSLISNLDMSVSEVVQLFGKISLSQQEATYPLLGGGGGVGGAPSPEQQAIVETYCVSNDLKCPTFCTKKEDLDCPSGCGDGIADASENYFNCPKDVPDFEVGKLFDYFKEEKFIQYIFIAAAGAAVLLSGKKKPKKQFKR